RPHRLALPGSDSHSADSRYQTAPPAEYCASAARPAAVEPVKFVNVTPAKTDPAPLMIISHCPRSSRRRPTARKIMIAPVRMAHRPKTTIAAARLDRTATKIPAGRAGHRLPGHRPAGRADPRPGEPPAPGPHPAGRPWYRPG